MPAEVGPAAVLWDMDGLLVDSEPLWSVAETDLLAGWGAVFTPAMKAAIVGTRMDLAVPLLISYGGEAAAGETVAGVSDRLLAQVVDLFRGALPLRPGAAALLAGLAAAGVPQALVSSSYRVLVDAALQALPGHPFTVSVAGDEVKHGKPHPEPYLTAAARLGVAPGACVVLEDSVSGARAGAAAGARVVYCPSVEAAGPPEAGWWPVASLAELSPAGLRSGS